MKGKMKAQMFMHQETLDLKKQIFHRLMTMKF